MIDPNTIELMNMELDGAATESQRTKLRRLLETDPEAREHFEALRALVSRLAAHPHVEPPSELHPRIVAAVAATPAPRPVRAPGFGAGWSAMLSPPRFRLATTFGLGLVTGVFLLAAVQFGRQGTWGALRDVNPAQVSGTIAPPLTSELLGSIPVPATEVGVHGDVTVFGGRDETVAEVSFDPGTPVSWILEFDPEALSVTRVETPGRGYFAVSPGQVHGTYPGQGPQRVVFSGRAEPVESFVLKVVKDDRVVFERSARPSQ
jgi:hypothetical protein